MNAMVKFCQCLSLATSKLLPWRQVVMLLASLSSIGEQYIKFECWGGAKAILANLKVLVAITMVTGFLPSLSHMEGLSSLIKNKVEDTLQVLSFILPN